jgi:uncharacterized membrane protein
MRIKLCVLVSTTCLLLLIGGSIYVALYYVLPEVGAYNYATIGGLTSLIAGAIAAAAARREHAPIAVSMLLGTLIGAAAGLIWPATAFLAFIWFTFGRDVGEDGGDRGDPPAVA